MITISKTICIRHNVYIWVKYRFDTRFKIFQPFLSYKTLKIFHFFSRKSFENYKIRRTLVEYVTKKFRLVKIFFILGQFNMENQQISVISVKSYTYVRIIYFTFFFFKCAFSHKSTKHTCKTSSLNLPNIIII